MVPSQTPVLIEIVKPKKLPTMIADLNLVAAGALVGYGVNYHEVGRLSAKHVRRVLAGTSPRDLPVESVDRVQLVLNLRVAAEFGLSRLSSGTIRLFDGLILLRLLPPRPRRPARDLAALLGGQFLHPSFAAETRKLGSVPGK